MFRTQTLVAAALLAVAGFLLALSREAGRAHAVGRSPAAEGARVERCVTCHSAAREDPGGAHAAAALGCEPCHLGNALAFTKERAHEGLEREPGALDTVARTCGRAGCHEREAVRVANLPMTRGDGIVSVDRFASGAASSPAGLARLTDEPAGSHVAKLCAGCHLGTRRANRDDAIVGSGSGCAACHVARRTAAIRRHPPVDAQVPDDRCAGCHAGSGRIALSYRGEAEVARGVFEKREPDVHREAGMSCVDCHLHTELMGDGTVREHKEAAVEIRCESCHGPGAPETTWAAVDEPVTRALLRMRREERPAGQAVRLASRGTPLWNVRKGRLFPKLGGAPVAIKATPRDANHTLPGHERLTCSACHSAWAPLCGTCHTSFDPVRPQWDFAAGRETPGAFIERGDFGTGAPARGVTADGRIVPAVPGMILETRRLFAPLEPHTTGKRARTCASCHLEPQAFQPGDEGTRPGFRPLDEAEEARVLAVGRCLACHREATDAIYRNFPRVLGRRTSACA